MWLMSLQLHSSDTCQLDWKVVSQVNSILDSDVIQVNNVFTNKKNIIEGINVVSLTLDNPKYSVQAWVLRFL